MLQIIGIHVNMMLSMANDSLNLHALMAGRFMQRCEKFSPIGAMQFVLKIFKSQSMLQKTEINLIPFDTWQSEKSQSEILLKKSKEGN